MFWKNVLVILVISVLQCWGLSTQRQIDINSLFDVTFVHRNAAFDIYQKSSLTPSLSKFNPPGAANHYINLLKEKKILSKDVIFTISNPYHLEESKKLYDFLMSSTDYDQFIATAQWIKKHVNGGLYLFTVSQALINFSETKLYKIPPIYELNPFYFYNYKVILEAQKYKMSFDGKSHGHIKANYSNYPVSYFTEDIGINSYYYYFNLYYPYWRETKHKKDWYYHFYQQFLARYYLERLSNNLGQIPAIDWYQPIEIPYNPQLINPNGEMLPIRPKILKINKNLKLKELEDLIYQIQFSIIANHVYKDKTKGGIHKLTELFIKTPLEKIARELVGLTHYETTARDPAFYSMYKRLIQLFQMFQTEKEQYHNFDLEYEVNITDVHFDKLETYFEDFSSEISHACYLNGQEYSTNSFKVFAQQKRLNHKPFNYTIKVNVQSSSTVYFKVFLGPKLTKLGEKLNLNENIQNFVLFDFFKFEGGYGEHTITRSSHENSIYAEDEESFYDFSEKIKKLHNENKEFDFGGFGMRQYLKFPKRFLLPKGTTNGFPYQFFVIAFGSSWNDFDMGKAPNTPDLFYEGYPLGVKTLGFPFDRHISEEVYVTKLKNTFFKVEEIYHV